MRRTKQLAKRIEALEARTTEKMTITFKMVTAPPDCIAPAMTCLVVDQND